MPLVSPGTGSGGAGEGSGGVGGEGTFGTGSGGAGGEGSGGVGGEGTFVISRELEAALKRRVMAVSTQDGFKGQEVTIILWSLASMGAEVEENLLTALQLQVLV